MRLNEEFVASFIVTLLASTFLFAPGSALAAPAKAVPAVKNEAADKNQGKQIAVSIPGLGEAKIVVTPAPAGAAQHGKPVAGKKNEAGIGPFGALSEGLKPGENISLKLPRSVNEFIDDMNGVGKRVGRSAQSGMTEVGKIAHWIAVYFKQFTGTPNLTPGAYPYVETPSPSPGAHVAKVMLTPEGRVKTIVSR